jgi:AcrR family transcriptional regulator
MSRKTEFDKESIIDAAFNVVRKKGWQGLSARSIADELNSSTRPIYYQLESMESLGEEVLRKAWNLFEEYMTTTVSGDKWIDQGVGHMRFAKIENELYKAIFDGNHHDIPSKVGQKIWNRLNENLADYPLFDGLSEETILEIRSARWIFNHGLATIIVSSPNIKSTRTFEDRVNQMKRISMAIFRGVTTGPPPNDSGFFHEETRN